MSEYCRLGKICTICVYMENANLCIVKINMQKFEFWKSLITKIKRNISLIVAEQNRS